MQCVSGRIRFSLCPAVSLLNLTRSAPNLSTMNRVSSSSMWLVEVMGQAKTRPTCSLRCKLARGSELSNPNPACVLMMITEKSPNAESDFHAGDSGAGPQSTGREISGNAIGEVAVIPTRIPVFAGGEQVLSPKRGWLGLCSAVGTPPEQVPAVSRSQVRPCVLKPCNSREIVLGRKRAAWFNKSQRVPRTPWGKDQRVTVCE